MPNKKNKNQAKNPFYYYMVSLRPQLERQGVVLANGMQTLAVLAGPRWKDLPEEEKEVYQEMARQAKANKQYGAPRNDRKDSYGQYISERVDTASLNEIKRRKQREDVKSTWPPGKLVCDERFFFIGFMSLFELSNEHQLPCELGVAEFSINGGIVSTMHKFINPGLIPLGTRYECMSTSDKTHKVPVSGLANDNDTYYSILLELMKFVNPEGKHTFPPVYSRASETKQTEACLNWLSINAGMPNRFNKVFELEGLICDLFSHIAKPDGQAIAKSQATDLISTTVFDYEPGARCTWHEEQEVKFCALGTVKRYSYCMADFLCPHYEVPLNTNHMPERPEGTFCTVLNTTDSPNSTTGRPPMGSPYKKTMTSYNRTGPTYEQPSLEFASGIDLPSLQQERCGLQQQQQYRELSNTLIDEGARLPFGRGRGRGRGMPAHPAMRQPSITTPIVDRHDVVVPGLLSRGRGVVRVPNTKPKVYAGSANAPHPSVAPPPPLAWQQQQQHHGYQEQQPQQQHHSYHEQQHGYGQQPLQHHGYHEEQLQQQQQHGHRQRQQHHSYHEQQQQQQHGYGQQPLQHLGYYDQQQQQQQHEQQQQHGYGQQPLQHHSFHEQPQQQQPQQQQPQQQQPQQQHGHEQQQQQQHINGQMFQNQGGPYQQYGVMNNVGDMDMMARTNMVTQQ